MTDAEIMKGVKLCNGDLGNCKECPFDSIGKACGIELAKAEIGLIERLQAENAALRERLKKAVELPSGDRVWFIAEDEEGKESYIISKPIDRLTVDELYEIGKKYFTTREAAEAKCAELEEEDDEQV